MAVTITGGKYASATISSVGTTTVTCTGTPFTTSDFNTARRVDLYNNAMTTLKGVAFARKANSTSVIELETEFFDPKTGSTVTQVAGGSPDKILISKNWADVVTAGISISGKIVTVSDTITFGTSGSISSLSFHDEEVCVVNTINTAYSNLYNCAGGVITFGHLQDYTNRRYYGSCEFFFSGTTTSCNTFYASSTSALLMMFGGSLKGTGSVPTYIGAAYNGTPYGTDWYYFWLLGVKSCDMDVMCANAGDGPWTTGSNHVVESCSFVGSGAYQNLVRWSNGTILGGSFKFLFGSSNPLAVFGGASGTYTVSANAGDRIVVSDIVDNALFWSLSSSTNTLNFTNVLSSSYASIYGYPTQYSNTNSTVNIYFKDKYTNLQDQTNLAVIRTSDWSIDSSATSSGSASSSDMTVFRSTATGSSSHTSRGPWKYRIRKYGYDEVEGDITETTYSLGTAGTAPSVSFGSIVNQIARTTLDVSSATALAYAGITVTDHGASPVTWNSKTWSITITVDTTTYPSRTINEVWKHIKAGIAQTSTWNGKTGILWHVILDQINGSYVTQRGYSGGAGATQKGVRIVNSSGNPFTGVSSMVADDGTTYTPPSTDTRGLTFTGLVSGSNIKVFDTGTTTTLFSTSSSSTTETWSEVATGSRTVDYTIQKVGYYPIRVTGITVTGASSGGVVSTPISQQVDRSYVTSSGLTYGTNAHVTTGTKKFGLTTTSTLQNFYSFMIESWISQPALANIAFPIITNGPNSFSFSSGWEFDTTTYPNSITNLSRDGLRYLNTSGTQTAIWSAILTTGVPSGLRTRFQQSDGGTTQYATVTSGDMDQLIQVYGDSSHGNFDYRSFLVLKIQKDGYDQAEADVVAQYGSLEDQLYVIGLVPTVNTVTTGDPGLASPPTITDHGVSPVTWNSKSWSITITDSSPGNTGENIMRWIRYNLGVGGTFQSKDAFDWHDLVQQSGSGYKTVRGLLYGDAGATIKGVRVVQNNGTSAHAGFITMTADDGTTYSTPTYQSVTITGLTANSRVQLYDNTSSTELYNAVVAGTSLVWTDSSPASASRSIRLRVAYCTSSTANQFIDQTIGTCGITSTDSSISYLVNPTVNSVYIANLIDGTSISDCSITGTSLHVDINTGSTTWQHIYAFMTYWLYTSGGIRDQYLEMTAIDQTNYVFLTAHGSFKVKNVTSPSVPLLITGGNAAPDTGAVTDILDTTGGTIFCIEETVVPFTYSTGSGLSTAEHNKLFSIPQDVWDTPTSSITTSGSVGLTIKNNVPLIPGTL